ncbi:CPBP family intramembrane glutamic endopeptidase [Corynebacterium kefirresidentii]|uniref:CPBP family intramembrane glutamic endopeptidase n=1 Tax=Corynebacterium kefirresidentii TaxID=1979527 RepID=UPI002653BA19|nr:CPBP family intramembrane glutamic endopeptidase [Corynebacterium kefirresidentii]MDN8635097.1 CPBP family intramembrane metalloprotease [Corynebacterium kefirresidentii]
MMNELKSSQIAPAVRAVHLGWALASVVATFAGAAVVGIACGLLGGGGTWVTFGITIGGAVFGLGTLWYGFSQRLGWSWRDAGFVSSAHSLWHLLWWIPVTILGCGAATGAINVLLRNEPAGNNLSDGLKISPAATFVAVLSTALVIPLVEEIAFRRVLLDWLQNSMPTWAAALTTIAVFAVAHGIPAVMLYIAFFGTCLVLARLWFKTLTAPLCIHIANNAVVAFTTLGGLSG